ncbi:SWIM zinc finger family protein [Streptomyces sp. WAC 01420]|uniref:SWIM zinc finger family protein n=1 Tax=Streptomyces sp. WAC 01420 TaxID=2203203 RepID=UPI00163BA504|nr:SWIM zinc finger family protein [Streptomyces sp. WAC 01420]
MTSRPSDKAREALRAARARTPRDPQNPPAATDRPPADRPADAAREALRRAARARRTPTDESTPPTEEAPGNTPEPPSHTHAGRSAMASGVGAADGAVASGAVAPGAGDDPGDSSRTPEAPDGPGAACGQDAAGPVVAPGGTGEDRAASAGRGPSSSGDDAEGQAVTPAGAGDDPVASAGRGSVASGDDAVGQAAMASEGARDGVVDSPSPDELPAESGPRAGTAPDGGSTGASRRPGDIAREALRSARAEAERARASAEGGRPGRRRGAPRVPRTTRGDRAADERARQVRAALADAFRMPDETDDHHPDATGGGPTQGDRPSAPGPVPPGGGPARGRTTPSGPVPPGGGPARGRTTPSGPVPPGGGPARDRTTPPGPVPPGGGPARDRTTPPGPVPPPASSRAVPHPAPRSMAAPARDGDLRRTFPAFPPRASDGGEGFAGTWWGRAWVTALEGGALDPARLARGRGYAEQGHVDAITVTPGLVLAYVRGSRPRPYRVQVRLRTFEEADWERFLDAAAERPGHIAALLDGEMPQSLADCGVPLLPAPGDLAPRCSCPDSGHPCKHAAALCYQTARLLDADPFVLLLLRGRGERAVIDALSRLSAARAARAAQEREPEPLPGVRAADAVARREQLPPLPAPLPAPPHPEQPPVYPASPGGPDPFALDQLATDAAARAHALLTTGRDPVGGLTLWHDAVRLAAARPGSGLTAGTRALYASLARAAGRTPADLARAVAAWRQGGPAGLAVLEEPWDPPAGRFDRARPLLLAADLPAFRPWRNHLTHPRGHVQLRLGRDHLWYAYESEPGHDDWWPRGTPDPDPVGALTGLDAPTAL